MINYDTFLFLENGTSADWNAIPFLEFPAFQTVVLNAMEDCRLESFFQLRMSGWQRINGSAFFRNTVTAKAGIVFKYTV